MCHRSGKILQTLLARSLAHSAFPPWDCLWFVAGCHLSSLKCVLDYQILARSVIAWLPQPNIHHWKGNMVTFHWVFKPHFILDLWMIILLHLWNRTAVCLLRMLRMLAWNTTIIFKFKVNWSFVSPYLMLRQWGLCCSWGLCFGWLHGFSEY